MSEALKKVSKLKKILSDLLSLERLEALAKKNMFISIAYAEALMHINYHLLTWTEPTVMTVGLVSKTFPLTIEGKLAGIAQSFAHSAGKLDNLLGTAAMQQLVGVIDVAADIAKGSLSASRVSQQITERGGD